MKEACAPGGTIVLEDTHFTGSFCYPTFAAYEQYKELYQELLLRRGGKFVRIQRETSLTAVSHLTCVCHTREELAAILDRYAASGIENILALGGDPPREPGRLRPRQRRLPVRRASWSAFIKARTNAPDPRGFGVGVAGFPEGHPGTPNRLKEMDYLKRKVDAGADYICTQLFFDNARLLRLPRALRAGRHPRADPRRDHADHLEGRHGPDGRARPGRAVPGRGS